MSATTDTAGSVPDCTLFDDARADRRRSIKVLNVRVRKMPRRIGGKAI